MISDVTETQLAVVGSRGYVARKSAKMARATMAIVPGVSRCPRPSLVQARVSAPEVDVFELTMPDGFVCDRSSDGQCFSLVHEGIRGSEATRPRRAVRRPLLSCSEPSTDGTVNCSYSYQLLERAPWRHRSAVC